MRTAFWAILLTLSALFGLGAMVYFIMRFTTGSLNLPETYWLVPLFGAIGGAVGGVLRNENKLALSMIEVPDRIQLGVVGDICLGLGGACAVVFLFGNTLQIDPKDDARSKLLLISISFLAGVFGKRIVELAGQKLLKQAEEKAKAVAQETVTTEVAPPAAATYAFAATELIRTGESIPKALEMAELALRYDPKSIHALIEKARALKRLGKVEEALATIEEALRIRPDEPKSLYNRACYMSILKKNSAEILADLKKAFQSLPELREDARKDPDFESMRSLPEFKNLVGEVIDSP